MFSQKIKNYISSLFLFAIALFFMVALGSYHSLDPSFNRATNLIHIKNFSGYYGAYIADPILQFFGLGSIIIIVLPLSWVIHYLKQQPVQHKIFKLNCGLIAMFAFSAILSTLPMPKSWIFESMGGYFGLFAFKHLELFLSFYPAFWVSFLTFICMIMLSLSISPSNVRNLFVNQGDNQSFKIDSTDCDMDYNELDEAETQVRQARIVAKKPENYPKSQQGNYSLPSLDLLNDIVDKKNKMPDSLIKQNTIELMQVLQDFGVKGEITAVYPGPVVTSYELEPSAGTKSSRVIGLSDDISRSMRALSSRIAVVPGRNALGIELPNKNRETVYLRELMESAKYQDTECHLPLILGKDISGMPIIVDLAKMPHLLVAGTTGSGKSVAINTMILSLLYHLPPDKCKFIMIDPKMLELSVYDHIPHLLTPVVTEPGKAVTALKWVVKEMENRYRLMSSLGVRNIGGYNDKINEAKKTGKNLDRIVHTGFNQDTGKPIVEKIDLPMDEIPYIVVVVDEMADLMLVAGKEIEISIQRLAQMARAAGIHIIMATQRPSVDVITGVIKANFPTRISFQVTSRIDSRTILGEQGAEQLLGKGDMLYMSGGSQITRVHGPFVSDGEVEQVVEYLKNQGTPSYIEDVTIDQDSEDFISDNESDDTYKQAVELVLRERKASTSYLQRCLRIGYNKAASIMDRMERERIVSAASATGKRDILASDK